MPSSGSDKLSASFSPSAIIVRPARYPSDLDELALVFQQSFWDDPWWRYVSLAPHFLAAAGAEKVKNSSICQKLIVLHLKKRDRRSRPSLSAKVEQRSGAFFSSHVITHSSLLIDNQAESLALQDG